MTDPITTDDLYGTSKDEKPQPTTPQQAKEPTSPKPMQYEETPEISIDHKASTVEQREDQIAHIQTTTQPQKKKNGCLSTIFTIIIFLALFIGGIWLSSFVRQFIPDNSTGDQQTETSPTPTMFTYPGITATSSASVAAWKTYDVISGTTKQPFAGVTFRLPPDVLSPICDGTGCASQGTYLPGGTRFTVAPRGTGQSLADFRGRVISDVGGISFTSKPTTVAGYPSTEFTGTFTGRTVSGYSFSRMRGVMIELTPTTSLEINHFTPNGIVADFASDDALFDEILKTVTVEGTEKGNAITSPIISPTALPSGY